MLSWWYFIDELISNNLYGGSLIAAISNAKSLTCVVRMFLSQHLIGCELSFTYLYNLLNQFCSAVRFAGMALHYNILGQLISAVTTEITEALSS